MPSALPSDAEIQVLHQLWGAPEQCVREIHEELSPDWDVGYTTVLKLLQRALREEPVDEEELREVLRLLDGWEEG